MIDDKQFLEAWDRIARTADGHVAYLYLQKRLMATSPNVESGTLRQLEGARIFASELIGLMAKGIEASATGLASSCITISRSGPVAVAGPRGAGRRVDRNTIVAGWNDGNPGPDAKSGTGSAGY